LNRPTGSTDWKDAEPNPKKIRGSIIMCWKYVVTFPEEGHHRPHQEYPPHTPCSFSHLDVSINAVLSMRATPRPLPISFQFLPFLHMPKRAKDVHCVVLTADCRNSVCLPKLLGGGGNTLLRRLGPFRRRRGGDA